MAQIKILAIILHLLFIAIYPTTCDEIQNITSSSSSSSSAEQFLSITECIKTLCPFDGLSSSDSFFSSVLSSRQIHLALLLPSTPQTDQIINTQTLSAVLPVIELAIQNVKKQRLLDGYELVIHSRDTKCSSTIGPIAAFELHNRNEADVFLGPICDYVLAPVARYASVWQKPVISTGGLATAFNFKVSVERYRKQKKNA
jgi:hypothetical protein